MKQLISAIRKRIHIHSYWRPIVSRYVSFNCRDIVYQCDCGKRIIERECRGFSEPFSIETTPFLTKSDLQKIVNYEKSI